MGRIITYKYIRNQVFEARNGRVHIPFSLHLTTLLKISIPILFICFAFTQLDSVMELIFDSRRVGSLSNNDIGTLTASFFSHPTYHMTIPTLTLLGLILTLVIDLLRSTLRNNPLNWRQYVKPSKLFSVTLKAIEVLFVGFGLLMSLALQKYPIVLTLMLWIYILKGCETVVQYVMLLITIKYPVRFKKNIEECINDSELIQELKKTKTLTLSDYERIANTSRAMAHDSLYVYRPREVVIGPNGEIGLVIAKRPK